MAKITFTVQGDPMELSSNRRLHPMARATLVRKWRTMGKVYALQARQAPFAHKVRISFTAYRAKRVDDDNLAGCLSFKGMRDGLKDAGLVVDDSPDHVVMGTVEQVVDKAYRPFPNGRGPFVEVTIEEVED